ncbi:MAG TPA: hypothetical protein VGN18_17695 [Jatrophihabitans sp.]|jgi:hypothetical protein|uniref:hypothetical protein n=1 Tax=Jatrophihabitans sp. TaxID=1932789 RepID=UPI002DF85348|nr:hypothetical protein [Jatrophihabitans sp.]
MRTLPALAALLLAGCASSASTGAGSPARSGPVTSSSAPSTPAATLQHPIPASSTSTGPLRCAQKPPYQVTIYKGLVTCVQADSVAAQFTRGGDAVQRIDGYTCQLGTARTRPVNFTCSSTGAEFTAADAVGPQTCPQLDKYRIRIVSGQITCTDAYDVAAQYRTQGESVQHLGGYTCQSGNAMTRPTVFTCTASAAEFAVDQP